MNCNLCRKMCMQAMSIKCCVTDCLLLFERGLKVRLSISNFRLFLDNFENHWPVVRYNVQIRKVIETDDLIKGQSWFVK